MSTTDGRGFLGEGDILADIFNTTTGAYANAYEELGEASKFAVSSGAEAIEAISKGRGRRGQLRAGLEGPPHLQEHLDRLRVVLAAGLPVDDVQHAVAIACGEGAERNGEKYSDEDRDDRKGNLSEQLSHRCLLTMTTSI